MLSAAKLSLGAGKDIQDIECFGNTGKSKAENISLLMERNKLSKEKTVYLGDTELDRESSEKAGIAFIFAGYGFGSPKQYAAKIQGLSELPKLLKEFKG